MSVQWFPGHMHASLESLKREVKNATAVMEVLDARLPFSSANPYIDKLCKGVIKIRVLNKRDLADPDVTERWLDFFKNKYNDTTIAITGKKRSEAWRAARCCEKDINRNPAKRTKIMIIGIPNTGKSTIINSLAGKKIARTGNMPAMTRHRQRVPIEKKMEIYDMPGVLWPVVEPGLRGDILAASGAISDSVIDYGEVGAFAITYLMNSYPALLRNRYNLEQIPVSSTELAANIALQRGFLKKGGIADLNKSFKTVIKEMQQGKIGRISLEKPEDLDRDVSDE